MPVRTAFSLIAHCDWSTHPKKRWMATSVRQGANWFVGLPRLVGDTDTLLLRLEAARETAGPLLAGFDFPIGVPAKYGSATGFSDFKTALEGFGHGQWSQWYEVAVHSNDISTRRPFYPMRPGGTKRSHLLSAHGLTNPDDLLRRCEQRTVDRGAACSLFWTLGGNQVGKAAITGWREIVAPRARDVALWPFDGDLATLADSHDVVLAETYPADACRRIGVPRTLRWSKRSQIGRQAAGKFLLAWLDRREIAADKEVHEAIGNGFGNQSAGEDQFDALAGLFGMIDVVDGYSAEGAPRDSDILQWEGWILGQPSDR